MIGAAEIRKLIPHAGSMCLLETVLAWDEASIVCETRSHLSATNPLAAKGRLSALHLVEYGAQAMAIHGGLIAMRDGQGVARPGLLAAAREVQLHCQDLAALAGPLIIRAQRLTASAAGCNYAFEAHCEGVLLGKGRVLVLHQP